MTAADYQQQYGKKAPQSTQAARTAPRPASATPKQNEAPTSEIKPTFPQSPGQPQTHLIGPYAVQLGGRLHTEQLPDRLRLVITGPAAPDAGLLRAVLQAVEKYCEPV